MSFLPINRLRPAVIVAVIAVVVACYAATAFADVPTWDSTLGGVNLEATSATAPRNDPESYWWEGSGSSWASQSITTIGLDTTGYEFCNTSWYYRWSDSDSQSNASYAQTYGWNYNLECFGQNITCETYSDHDFVQSGSFGAYPTTYDDEVCIIV